FAGNGGRPMPRRSRAELDFPHVATELPQRLKPPDSLSAGAREEFLRIVSCEKPEHFRPSDVGMLVQYTEACALAAKSIDAIHRDLPGPRWLANWQVAVKVMKDLSLRLRLSPQSRQSNHHSRPETSTRPMSIYERMRLAEKDDAEPGRNSLRLD